MSTYSISGTTSAVANTASSVTLTARWSYLTLENTGATLIYVRTDGSLATVGGDSCYAVEPGQVGLVANQLPLWTEAATVIPAGAESGTTGSGTPPEVQPPTAARSTARRPTRGRR